jgi:hypothetical protein
MKKMTGSLSEDNSQNDNFRVKRYIAKITINTAITPKQKMPKPRLKKAQLLLGSLAKRCNQLIFISLLS